MTAHFFICPEIAIRALPESLREKGVASTCKEGVGPDSDILEYEYSLGKNKVHILATRTPDGTYFINVHHGLNPFFWSGNKRLLKAIISILETRGATRSN